MSKEAIVVTEDAGALKAKVTEARALTDKARSLADVRGSNVIEIGLLCRKFKNEPALYKSLGFHIFDKWREDTFGVKKATAKTSQRIVDSLLPIFSEDDILGMGKIKALAYCRLPESEQIKDTWKAYVGEDDSTSFAARVKAFLKGDDHREDFCKISFDSPKSFRDETFNRVVELGKKFEVTTDTFMVVEAAMACYEQEVIVSLAQKAEEELIAEGA